MSEKKELVMNRPVEFSERPPFPINIMVGLTTACNHRCIMCAHRLKTRKRVDIDAALLKRLIPEAFAAGAREIGFYFTGEPFLSKDFEDHVRLAKETGYAYIYTTTNGVYATPERLAALFENGLNSIKFSVNAGDGEIYRQVHGKDDFERVVKNIESAHRIREERKWDVKIFVSLIENRVNSAQGAALRKRIDGFVDKTYVFPAINMGGKLTHEIDKGFVGANDMKACPQVFNRIHITPAGFLSACCTDFDDELIVADLHSVSLEEAWHNEKYRSLRRQHLDVAMKKDLLCYNCLHNTALAVAPL